MGAQRGLDAHFYPCGYDAKTFDDAGNETNVKINEVADIANYITKGRKPPTGLRFSGQKYFPCGGTPRKEADGVRYLFLAKGTGTNLIISVSTKFVYIAKC